MYSRHQRARQAECNECNLWERIKIEKHDIRNPRGHKQHLERPRHEQSAAMKSFLSFRSFDKVAGLVQTVFCGRWDLVPEQPPLDLYSAMRD
jgi:hypothetical protein